MFLTIFMAPKLKSLLTWCFCLQTKETKERASYLYSQRAGCRYEQKTQLAVLTSKQTERSARAERRNDITVFLRFLWDVNLQITSLVKESFFAKTLLNISKFLHFEPPAPTQSSLLLCDTSVTWTPQIPAAVEMFQHRNKIFTKESNCNLLNDERCRKWSHLLCCHCVVSQEYQRNIKINEETKVVIYQ